MSRATRADADLILRLYDLRREETMRKARRFMMDEFYAANGKEFYERYPSGTEKNAWFRQTMSYWDMVAAFVKSGLLNAELLFETNAEFRILWEKARATILDIRKMRKMPYYYKNLEDLAGAHDTFAERRAPGSSAFYASFNQPPAARRTEK
jgi:hypothetical protein